MVYQRTTKFTNGRRSQRHTLPETSKTPETSITPETLGLEDEFPFGFRPPGRCYVSFGEYNCPMDCSWLGDDRIDCGNDEQNWDPNGTLRSLKAPDLLS